MAIRIEMCVSDSSIFVTELTVLCCVFVVFVVFVVVVVIGIVTCGIYTRKPGRFRFDSNRIRTKNAQFCHWNGVPNKVLLREPTWKISMHVGYMLRIICHEMKNGIEWNNPLHVCGAMCFFLPLFLLLLHVTMIVWPDARSHVKCMYSFYRNRSV